MLSMFHLDMPKGQGAICKSAIASRYAGMLERFPPLFLQRNVFPEVQVQTYQQPITCGSIMGNHGNSASGKKVLSSNLAN